MTGNLVDLRIVVIKLQNNKINIIQHTDLKYVYHYHLLWYNHDIVLQMPPVPVPSSLNPLLNSITKN